MIAARIRTRRVSAPHVDSPIGYHSEYPVDIGPVWPWLYEKNLYMPVTDELTVETCTDTTNGRIGGKYLTGGPFAMNRYESYVSQSHFAYSCPKPFVNNWWYKGESSSWNLLGQTAKDNHFFASSGFTTASKEADLASYGSRAWNRFKPGKPDAGLLQFIAEIRDVPHTLRDTCFRLKQIYNGHVPPTPKQLGKDYITYQFGWAPFLRDLRNFYNLWRKFDDRLANIRRLNGQWIRRGGSVAVDTARPYVWQNEGIPFSPLPPGDLLVPNSHGISGQTVATANVWFEGSFRYYIPPSEMEKPEWARQMGRKLSGMRLTPALVYELIPWSWFVDYFLHVGSLLESLDHGVLGEVAAKYAYLMGTYEIHTSQSAFVSYKNVGTLSGTSGIRSVIKLRSTCSPFGLGLTGDFTPSQLAILTGLGLSRT